LPEELKPFEGREEEEEAAAAVGVEEETAGRKEGQLACR
jgi:hypothetical protein